jgi:tRNA threonylcarbamoyladenosine biosynthesis protein TsaB
MLVLSIETATRRGSVCLTRDGEILASATGEPAESHSNTLLRAIKQLLDESHLTLNDIDLFAVAAGPGSFTGLRIGLASIKALAVTLKRPCIGVPTLQAVARSGGTSKASVALLPAGRGELFAQLLSVLPDQSVVELDQPVHIAPRELLEKYASLSAVRWCGEGAHAHRDEILEFAQRRGHVWTLAPAELMLATHVAGLALKRFEEGDTGDANNLRALYVRPSDAELKSNVHHPGSS